MPNLLWDEKKLGIFRKKLFTWYRKHQRKVPWRSDINPYKVWISEIMLQQTQTRTVLPYYERFLSRFPDLHSLAQASETEVLQLWAGLGYYSRARNLHAAARLMVSQYKSFPRDFHILLTLPGIGRYTAGAICSIAFGKPYPVVDGNVRRVVSRLAGIQNKIPEDFYWDTMSTWIGKAEAALLNQGIMELGAIICTPYQPGCPGCPVQAFCIARQLGLQASIPIARRKQPVQKITVAVLILERDGRILICSSGRQGLIPGDNGLPWCIVLAGTDPRHMADRLCRETLGKIVPLKPRSPIRHSITHHHITAVSFAGSLEKDFPWKESGSSRWVRRSSAGRLVTSSLFRKLLIGAV